MITLGSHLIPTGERDSESSDHKHFPGLITFFGLPTLGCSLAHGRLLPAFAFSQPSCKWSPMTTTALSFLAHGHFRVAFHSPFAIPLHTVSSPSHMVPRAFAISQLSLTFAFASSLHTAAFPQRSLSAVFPHVVACAGFHLSLLSLHAAAFASSCLFTVPRTRPLLTALASLTSRT